MSDLVSTIDIRPHSDVEFFMKLIIEWIFNFFLSLKKGKNNATKTARNVAIAEKNCQLSGNKLKICFSIF